MISQNFATWKIRFENYMVSECSEALLGNRLREDEVRIEYYFHMNMRKLH
jgi:hypothetical protein